MLEHVRAWPDWIEEMRHAGGQAYAVLTLCLAAEAFATGQQVFKVAAAAAGRVRRHQPATSDGSGAAGALVPNGIRKAADPPLPGQASLR